MIISIYRGSLELLMVIEVLYCGGYVDGQLEDWSPAHGADGEAH